MDKVAELKIILKKLNQNIQKLKLEKKNIIENIKKYSVNKNKTKQEDILENKNITKNEIITLFNNNIKGKKYVKEEKSHDGGEGHWLESNMNLKKNSNNAPDIGGYEMKKESKKISNIFW